jgi:iodotyrosine deiodinase
MPSHSYGKKMANILRIGCGSESNDEPSASCAAELVDPEATGVRRRSRLARVPLAFQRLDAATMDERARAYADAMQKRRSVRAFSPDSFPLEIVDHAIRAAASAPSGAHQQPWTFVVVTDPETKAKIRDAAEVEERKNWDGRMPEAWVAAVEPLGVDAHKAHLTDAPAIVVVFAQTWGMSPAPKNERIKHYYVDESVGIAVGMLLSALHLAGLTTLTHTPTPMAFLRELLGRPANERAFAVIPVGYPAADADVPALVRKHLDDVRILR